MINKNAENDIVDVLNKMIQACEPILFGEFNLVMKEKEQGLLDKLEKQDDRIGIRPVVYKEPTGQMAISTMSIIATLTDICVGKRLAVDVDKNGFITGVKWYNTNTN